MRGFFAFGFRADTAQYSYLIRLNPYKGEENLFIYCYRRDWLDRHMKQAGKGIRFITPGYKEKFRIEDGDMVRIRRYDGTSIDRVCRYIDEYHLEVGDGWDSLFHICQFAEMMERCQILIPSDAAPAGEVLYRQPCRKTGQLMLERALPGIRCPRPI